MVSPSTQIKFQPHLPFSRHRFDDAEWNVRSVMGPKHCENSKSPWKAAGNSALSKMLEVFRVTSDLEFTLMTTGNGPQTLLPAGANLPGEQGGH